MLIYRGAEAELYKETFLSMAAVRKVRKAKRYKNKLLDDRLRSERLKNEARMLSKAREFVDTPHVLAVDGNTLVIEYVDGEKVKDLFLKKKISCATKIGTAIRKMHNGNIVHNDLTTSNLILSKGKIVFIDFGLAEISPAVEEKAVDLVVFKRMLSSTHYDVFDKVWPRLIKGYKPNKAMLNKIKDIESRAKYK